MEVGSGLSPPHGEEFGINPVGINCSAGLGGRIKGGIATARVLIPGLIPVGINPYASPIFVPKVE